MTDNDLSRQILGVVEIFENQNHGPVPKHAVINYCVETDTISLSRERIEQHVQLLIQKGDIEETEAGLAQP